MQKFVNYETRIAIVLPADQGYGIRVTELAREHATHPYVTFVTTEQPAVKWLTICRAHEIEWGGMGTSSHTGTGNTGKARSAEPFLRRQMRLLIAALLYFFTTNLCLADEAERQAASFARIYTSYCVRRIDDLDAFKGQLESVPPLAPAGAALFLNGQPGAAWPVPDLEGLFVLALPEEPDLCIVYGRRASAAKVEELFIELVLAPVAPFLVRKTGDHFIETPRNGTTHIIDYEWYTEDSSRKIAFMLSTSGLENAELQVAGSVAINE